MNIISNTLNYVGSTVTGSTAAGARFTALATSAILAYTGGWGTAITGWNGLLTPVSLNPVF
jgi:hypothetical protein